MQDQVFRMESKRITLLALALVTITILSVSAAQADTRTTIGTDELVLQTVPAAVSSGASTLVLTLTNAEIPRASVPMNVKLTSGKRTYFESTLITDAQGIIQIDYFFDVPGEYVLTIKQESGATAVIPLHVRGQALLLIGFLTAIAIALGILLDKRAAASVF